MYQQSVLDLEEFHGRTNLLCDLHPDDISMIEAYKLYKRNRGVILWSKLRPDLRGLPDWDGFVMANEPTSAVTRRDVPVDTAADAAELQQLEENNYAVV